MTITVHLAITTNQMTTMKADRAFLLAEVNIVANKFWDPQIVNVVPNIYLMPCVEQEPKNCLTKNRRKFELEIREEVNIKEVPIVWELQMIQVSIEAQFYLFF
jgi:hypothetical protein